MIIRIKKSLLKESKEEEVENPEKLFFGGDLADIGESLSFLVFNNTDMYGDVDHYAINQILKDSGQTNIQYAGQGAFRITYSHGEHEVFKIAKSNTARVMNQQDATLGKLPIYSTLFPKVYKVDKNFDWIVMERCVEIDDTEVFMNFFPNRVLNSYAKAKYFSAYNTLPIFQTFLAIQSQLIKGDPIYTGQTMSVRNLTGNDAIFTADMKKIVKGYGPTFQLLAKMVAEFGVSTVEIRPYNTGIAPDGRFVVIDSSIASAIDAGLRSLNSVGTLGSAI